MNPLDAFDRILASLHQAALDDAHWPATAALIDEACGFGRRRHPAHTFFTPHTYQMEVLQPPWICA